MKRSKATEEKITVVAYSGYRGEETPREFILHGNKVEVIEIVTAWIEQESGYKPINSVPGDPHRWALQERRHENREG